MRLKLNHEGMEYVFQVDSEIVNKVRRDSPNYLIESTTGGGNICAIYFSSNDIYYPNNEEIFRKRIVEKNFYEWYKIRIEAAGKHIFIRDVYKQWYLKGINSEIDSIEKLYEFLKAETTGYQIITVGSSAGGYAAVLFGCMLNAIRVLAFNPQFEIQSLTKRTDESINPLVHRLKNTEVVKYFDLFSAINFSAANIFYFCSIKSPWDIQQYNHIESDGSIHRLCFNTSHHGIPFLKVALSKVLNMPDYQLMQFEHSANLPLYFTIRCVGLITTIKGLINQVIGKYKRRH